MTSLELIRNTKPSGLLWLNKIPISWKLERAKNCFNKMERPVMHEDKIVTCFRDGTVTLRENRRLEGYTESLKEIGYQGIRVGDLVIHSMDAYCGAIGVSDSNGKGSPVYSVCRPKSMANSYYYAHLLREMARNGWIGALSKGIRERSSDFRYSDFSAQLLPLPPMAIQGAIVQYLDHADQMLRGGVSQKQELAELMEEYKRAVIQQSVTRGLDLDVPLKPSEVEWIGDIPEHWSLMKLKQSFGINELTLSEKTDPEFQFNYLEIGSVGTGNLTNEPSEVKFKEAPSSARRIIRNGDTIVSRVRFNLQSIWFANKITGNLIGSTGFAVLTPGQFILPEYTKYMLMSDYIKSQGIAYSTGVHYPTISDSDVGLIVACIPPLEEQAVIVAYLDKLTSDIDAAIAHTRREIELLEEYRTRLIADVVTGKLDVREAAANLPDVNLDEIQPLAEGGEADD